MEEFAEARNKRNRHPDWQDVAFNAGEFMAWLSGDTAPAAPPAPAVAEAGKRRGPKPKVIYQDFYNEVRRVVDEEGFPDPRLDSAFRQADLERHMMRWHNEAIGTTQNRKLVRDSLRTILEQSNQPQK
jgi:hypothetical protein